MSKQVKKVLELLALIVASLTNRATFARDAGNAVQAAFFAREANAWTTHHVTALQAAGVDVSALAQILAVADKASGAGFVAKYAAQKVRQCADALAQNSIMRADRYTQALALNTARLEKLGAKGALVCLSSSITYDEMDTQQQIKRYGNCTAGTASTQRSSTREALRVLGIASVTKGKRDDAIEWADTESARAFKALADAALQ